MPATPSPDLLALGLHIRHLREQADMSIEALAEAAGMSWRGLIYIEHGQRNPTYRTLATIAGALGQPLTIPVPDAG